MWTYALTLREMKLHLRKELEPCDADLSNEEAWWPPDTSASATARDHHQFKVEFTLTTAESHQFLGFPGKMNSAYSHEQVYDIYHFPENTDRGPSSVLSSTSSLLKHILSAESRMLLSIGARTIRRSLKNSNARDRTMGIPT